jgi:hypothetical protein
MPDEPAQTYEVGTLIRLKARPSLTGTIVTDPDVMGEQGIAWDTVGPAVSNYRFPEELEPAPRPIVAGDTVREAIAAAPGPVYRYGTVLHVHDDEAWVVWDTGASTIRTAVLLERHEQF